MTLAAGTTLQNGKYVIQAVLNQSEFGITYQANHVYLDESVLLQTLESKPSDFQKAMGLQQKFLAGVRRLAKGEHPYPGRVLDFFTEQRMPYVVLEYVPEHPLPDILDWLLSTSPPQKNLTDVKDTLPKSRESVAANDMTAIAQSATEIQDFDGATTDVAAELTAATEMTMDGVNRSETPTFERVTNGAVADGTLANGAAMNGTSAMVSPNGAVTNGAVTNGVVTNGASATVVVAHPPGNGRSPSVPSAKRKTSPWLPISLLFTTAIAGLAGAGFGWSLRFHPTAANRPSFFQNEQSFPPTEGWPIQEEIDRSRSTSEWERPVERNYEAPVRDYRPAPEVAPIEPVEDKVAPEEEFIPKTPDEFEGGDPLVPDAPPVPDPSDDPIAPPVDSGYVPPPEAVPAPVIEVQPPAPVAPDPVVQPSPPAQ